jgi:hypothetical protein
MTHGPAQPALIEKKMKRKNEILDLSNKRSVIASWNPTWEPEGYCKILAKALDIVSNILKS